MYSRVVKLPAILSRGSHIALMMEAVRTSETSVNIYLTARQYIAEDCKLMFQLRLCSKIPLIFQNGLHFSIMRVFGCKMHSTNLKPGIKILETLIL
jgi:hypothetical protein